MARIGLQSLIRIKVAKKSIVQICSGLPDEGSILDLLAKQYSKKPSIFGNGNDGLFWQKM